MYCLSFQVRIIWVSINDMQIKLRKHLKIKEKCLVVKLSSLALTKESGKIDKKQLSNIFSEVSLLKKNYDPQNLFSSGKFI